MKTLLALSLLFSNLAWSAGDLFDLKKDAVLYQEGSPSSTNQNNALPNNDNPATWVNWANSVYADIKNSSMENFIKSGNFLNPRCLKFDAAYAFKGTNSTPNGPTEFDARCFAGMKCADGDSKCLAKKQKKDVPTYIVSFKLRTMFLSRPGCGGQDELKKYFNFKQNRNVASAQTYLENAQKTCIPSVTFAEVDPNTRHPLIGWTKVDVTKMLDNSQVQNLIAQMDAAENEDDSDSSSSLKKTSPVAHKGSNPIINDDGEEEMPLRKKSNNVLDEDCPDCR